MLSSLPTACKCKDVGHLVCSRKQCWLREVETGVQQHAGNADAVKQIAKEGWGDETWEVYCHTVVFPVIAKQIIVSMHAWRGEFCAVSCWPLTTGLRHS